MLQSSKIARYSCVSLITFAGALQAQTTLPTIDVTDSYGESTGALTVPDNQTAIEQIQRTSGAVAVVDAETFEDTYAVNFADTLAYVPGVYAQTRYAEEVRLAIRGSGLSRGFHLRGITLLQDGIPYSLADGSGDFQEADFLALQRLEVYKGGNALQYGSSTLGGAVNLITKNGRSNPGTQIQAEYGSDETYRLNLQSGKVEENFDIFGSITGTSSNGYRSHEDRESLKINTNVGIRFSPTIESRFYLSGNIIDQDLAGAVSRDNALDNPRDAGAGAVANDIARDIHSVRLANKTTFALNNGGTLDVGAFLNLKDLYHPLNFGVIDQEYKDYGLFAQQAGNYELGGFFNKYRIGLTTHFGETDAQLFTNNGGSRGFRFANANQKSQNAVLYGENSLYLTPEWALVTGGQLVWNEREEENIANPAESDKETYTAFNPKIGVLYEPSDDVQFFANVSRSEEAPTFAELTQFGVKGFVPLKAQEAITYEIGTRGTYGPYRWNVAAYRAEIDNELLQFTTGVNVPAATFNADKTIHQGFEIGFDARLGQNLFSNGDHLQIRNAYTYSDFKFDGDDQYGDNTIAGQPEHYYQAELRYDHPAAFGLNGWHIAPNVEWVPSGAEVDFENSLDAPGYVVVGLSAGIDVNDNVSIFADGRNLLDEDYIATFSTITDAATANTNVFYPGEGRTFFGGIRIRF